MNSTKQVIVWRNDLRNSYGQKLHTGKIAAQVAHASLGAILSKMTPVYGVDGKTQTGLTLDFTDPNNEFLVQWLQGSFTKIVLKANTESDIKQLFMQAQLAGLPAVLIIDNGLTEFDRVPTVTCVGIGPGDPATIDTITSGLSLL